MWSRRRLATSLLLSLLALTVLFGCRAFEPAVVIVNKPPETYIIGAPAETSGGYFHFHVWWYGTDEDGQVTKYVWALTDSSIQDHTVEGDEEDSRFNPATNASTLRIGHWTTRTDTTFDFTIRRGANLANDMTLHMVAVDDRGAYDRTPARLHFISNAIGTPSIRFYADTLRTIAFADSDTIGYGQPFVLAWSGRTDNIRSYTPQLLAERDTVGAKDGLLGFKFRLPEVRCDAAREDCWQPRRGVDSVSYFSRIDRLTFTNDNSGTEPRKTRLAEGMHQLLVNTLDVAGVEVPAAKQILHFVVNYDPDTKLVRGPDPIFTNDTHTYPYYVIFKPNATPGGPAVPEEHAFAEGDTVPDKAYVVFKAWGWDDPRDQRLGTSPFDVKFQAAFEDTGMYGGQSRFPFSTQFSVPHWTDDGGNQTWDRRQVTGPGGKTITVSADTIGFPVGPFKYKFIMRTVDELGRRDGTPETFTFYGNRRPCVQGVEVLVGAENVSPDADMVCNDPARLAQVDTIYALSPEAAPMPGERYAVLLSATPDSLYYSTRSNAVWLAKPPSTLDVATMPGYFYEYRLALHGKDDPRETWDPAFPQDRILSWNYQVESARDSTNIVSEGGGIDDINFPTYQADLYDPNAYPPQPVYIDDEGVWVLRIKFFVPQFLANGGYNFYLMYLRDIQQYPDFEAILRLTTLQLGGSSAQVIANDATTCVANARRSSYHYMTQLRFPDITGGYGDLHPRWTCQATFPGEAGKIRLSDFSFGSTSLTKTPPETPYTKRFVIKVRCSDSSIYP